MKKVLNSHIKAGSGKCNEPRLVGEIINQILQSNSHFAAAVRRYRAAKAVEERSEPDPNFWEVYPHTEPCVDLKLFTQRPGPLDIGAFLPGVITRDGEYHFSFVQNVVKERLATRRTPCIYRGAYLNVHRADDGSMYVTFRRPRLTKNFTFADYCRAAAEELFIVSGLVEE